MTKTLAKVYYENGKVNSEIKYKDGHIASCKDLQVLKDKKYYLIDDKCTRCGSTHTGDWAYGLIRLDQNEKLDKKRNRGELRLGGCMIRVGRPKHFCLECGTNLFEYSSKDKNISSIRYKDK